MGSSASSAGSECRRFCGPLLAPAPPAPAPRLAWGPEGGRPLLPDPAAAWAAAAAATSACHLCWNWASGPGSDSACAPPGGRSFFCFLMCSGTSMDSTLHAPRGMQSKPVAIGHHVPLPTGLQVRSAGTTYEAQEVELRKDGCKPLQNACAARGQCQRPWGDASSRLPCAVLAVSPRLHQPSAPPRAPLALLKLG